MAADPNPRRSELHERDVDPDPFRQFAVWFADAIAAGLTQPEAMALATSTPDGRPSVRMVLLKGFDERAFVFYTNAQSRKGRELAANPNAAIAINWEPLHRQVRAIGTIQPVSAAESDAYFASRLRGAQLAAAASAQSRVIPSRDALTKAYARLEAEFEGRDVARPASWGGFRLTPVEIELWQGRENRLHDRLRYTRETRGTRVEGGWRIERLAP